MYLVDRLFFYSLPNATKHNQSILDFSLTKMADNKGLDALATLCGGVQKAQVPTDSSSRIPGFAASQFTPPIAPTAQPPAPSTIAQQRPLMSQTDASATTNGKPPTPHNPFLASPDLSFPWSQALTASNKPPGLVDGVGAALIAAAANNGGETPITMQQLAYKQYLQAQVAAQAAAAQAHAAHFGNAAHAAAQAAAAVQARATRHSTTATGNSSAAVPSIARSPVKLSSPELAPHKVIQLNKEPEIAPLPRNAAPAPSNSISRIKHSQAPLSIAPQESTSGELQAAVAASSGGTNNCIVVTGTDDKQQVKRAANRRSAQLSRKRKKKFIEELKEENDGLRRKEQILRSIPDLIIAFDSAGKLGFVSESVSRILDFTPSELEGNSFWDRLCEESVKLLKAAFMDALAARKSDVDTSPLGSGVLELQLVDRNGSHIAVTMNGIVHVSGESPECVGSIRPLDDNRSASSNNNNMSVAFAAGTATTAAGTRRKLPGKLSTTLSATAREVTSSSDNSTTVQHPPAAKARRTSTSSGTNRVGNGGIRQAAQISDSESVVSESC